MCEWRIANWLFLGFKILVFVFGFLVCLCGPYIAFASFGAFETGLIWGDVIFGLLTLLVTLALLYGWAWLYLFSKD